MQSFGGGGMHCNAEFALGFEVPQSVLLRADRVIE